MPITIGLGLDMMSSGGGAPAPFTPAALGPFAWYDTELGGSATEITDSSNYERAAATCGAGAAAPAFAAGAYTFDGIDDFIDVPVAAFPDLTAGPWTYCAVASADDIAAGAHLVSLRSAGTYDSILYFPTASTCVHYVEGSAWPTPLTVGPGMHVFFAAGDGDTLINQALDNGALDVLSKAQVSAFTEAVVGREATTSMAFAAVVFKALIVFDRALTAPERAQIVSYYEAGT